MRSQESWARPGGPKTKSPGRGVSCVPGRGLFLAPLPHPVIGQEQPVRRVSSAEAEMDVEQRTAAGAGPITLPGAGGLQGACSWLLSGCLNNKLCGPGSSHTQSEHHVTGWNVPWNWPRGPGSRPWLLLTSSVTLDTTSKCLGFLILNAHLPHSVV